MSNCKECEYEPICNLIGYYSEGEEECSTKKINLFENNLKTYNENPEEYIKKYREKRKEELEKTKTKNQTDAKGYTMCRCGNTHNMYFFDGKNNEYFCSIECMEKGIGKKIMEDKWGDLIIMEK